MHSLVKTLLAFAVLYFVLELYYNYKCHLFEVLALSGAMFLQSDEFHGLVPFFKNMC